MQKQLKIRFAAIGLVFVLVFLGCGPAWGEPARPEVKLPVIGYGELVNGDFDQGLDEFGGPGGWTVWFSEKGKGNASTSWGISQEADNPLNTTKKLSLSNNLGHNAGYSVSQEIYHVKAGTYTAALLFEGDSDDRSSGSVLSVNGMETELGSFLGWKNWKQAVLPDIAVEEGGTVRIEIRGTMLPDQWLDLDHIQFVPSDEFQESEDTRKAESQKSRQAEPVKDEAPYAVTGQIQNGTFNRGVQWDVKGYPDGYLDGWTLPKADWDTWIYDGDQGQFNIANISNSKDISEYELKQNVRLKPGSYQIDSVIGGRWSDSVSDNEVCIRVAQPDGELIGERYWKAGYGQAVSDEFVIDGPMEVTVSFTFMLRGGNNASLDNVAIYSYPAKVKLKTVSQVGGRKGKDDTTKLRVTFDRPIFGLEKEDFSVEGATVIDMENKKNGTYILSLDDLKEADGKAVALTVENPEGTVISSRRQKVKIYRDNDGIPFHLANGDFSTDVDWLSQDHPDGYLEGWQLPKIDWNIWRYKVSDGLFHVDNISESGGSRRFKIHQVIRLEPGTYYLEADSPGAADEGNANGITISAKSGNRTLARVSSYPGCGSMSTDGFTLEKEASVEISAAFNIPAGGNAALDYIAVTDSQLPPPPTPPEPELPDHIVNGDFATGIDWAQVPYPNGYLEGWNLPASVDWNTWKYNTNSGNFELNNISADNRGTFSISQSIKLTAGAYRLNAASPWTWDAGNPTGITLTVKNGDQTLATLQKNPGYGDFAGTEFTLAEDAKVTVTVLFDLPAGKTAAIDDVTVDPATPTPPEPELPDHIVNGDFSQDMTWSPTALPGWTIPADAWAVWSPNTVNGSLRVKNIMTDESTTAKSYEITQDITLSPGTYKIKGEIPQSWIAVADGSATVTLSAGDLMTVQSAPLSEWTENQSLESDPFQVEQDTALTVTVRFDIPSGKTGDPSYVDVDNIEIAKVQ